MTVTVTDSEKGYLEAEITGDEGLTFVNVYEKPAIPEGPVKTSDDMTMGLYLAIMAVTGTAMVVFRRKSVK